MKWIFRFFSTLFILYLIAMAIGYVGASIREGAPYGLDHFGDFSPSKDFSRSAFLAGMLTIMSLMSLAIRLWPGSGPFQSGISILTGVPIFSITLLCMGDRSASFWLAFPFLLTGLPILLEILRFFRR